jgi:hypothetical protein
MTACQQLDSRAHAVAAPLVRFTAELVCLLCGRIHGSLDGGSSWPPRGEALLSRPGGAQSTPVTSWWRLRCATCGGALLATEIISHSMRPEAVVDWTTVGIRRGRPPNWLVAERAADVARNASAELLGGYGAHVEPAGAAGANLDRQE